MNPLSLPLHKIAPVAIACLSSACFLYPHCKTGSCLPKCGISAQQVPCPQSPASLQKTSVPEPRAHHVPLLQKLLPSVLSVTWHEWQAVLGSWQARRETKLGCSGRSSPSRKWTPSFLGMLRAALAATWFGSSKRHANIKGALISTERLLSIIILIILSFFFSFFFHFLLGSRLRDTVFSSPHPPPTQRTRGAPLALMTCLP